MPLFGRRREAPVALAAPPPPVGTLACSQAGCAATTGIACAYVDRRGRACETAWCPEHRAGVGEAFYCRRHAGVVRALEGSETPTPPDLGSRAASLAAWVAADLGPGVVSLLERVRGADDHLRVQAPRCVFVGAHRARAWEHAWKLTRHTGLGRWVAIIVREDRDDHVDVTVDGVLVHESIPPWIAARTEGRPVDPAADAHAREDYYAEILDAVQARLALLPES